jgi:protein-tyrosine phosphatase
MNRLVQLIQDNHGTHRGWVRLLLAQVAFVLGRFTPWTQVRIPVVRRLVFVCLGNINRSAFADVLAQKMGAQTASFGLSTTTGSPAYEMAIRTAPLFDVTLHTHRATDMSDYQYRDGDLLAVMEMRQVHKLLNRGVPAEAIVLLGYWAAPRRLHIHDPHTLSARYFVTCFAILDSAVRSLVQELKEKKHPVVSP